jgi:hypothetical protein
MQLAPRLAAPRSGCTFPRRRLGWTRSKRSRLVNPRHARRTVALRASASPNVRQDRCRVRASPRACAKALSSCGPPCPTAPSLTAWRTRTFAPSLHQAPSFKTTASVSHAPWRTANRPSKRPRFLDRKEVCFSISGWAEGQDRVSMLAGKAGKHMAKFGGPVYRNAVHRPAGRFRERATLPAGDTRNRSRLRPCPCGW